MTTITRKMKFLIMGVIVGIMLILPYLQIISWLTVEGQPIGNRAPIPVLLIHGYASDSNMWNEWEQYLNEDNIPYKSVTFNNDDSCGSSIHHAEELIQIVDNFMLQTGAEKINIVAHSKGGLDARVYLANGASKDNIANLIMIGTPNKGSPLADRDHESDPCKPAVFDLMTNSTAINALMNPNTMYYTIGGNWISQFNPWTFMDNNCMNFSYWYYYQQSGRVYIQGPDDGVVPLSSAQPGGFIPLGQTDNCHSQLLNDDSYDIASQILKQ